MNQLPPHPPVEPEAASENLAAAGLPERVVAETPQPPTTQPIPELPGPAVVVERPPPELIAGRYSIERELARGGMGRIYVAYDRVLGRPVALKMLKKAHGPVSIERFRREARAVSGLSHPNIVAIHDAGDENGSRTSFRSSSADAPCAGCSRKSRSRCATPSTWASSAREGSPPRT